MKIREHTDLEVYKKAFDTAMLIFELSKKFLYKAYDEILRMLVAMINKPQSWVIAR